MRLARTAVILAVLLAAGCGDVRVGEDRRAQAVVSENSQRVAPTAPAAPRIEYREDTSGKGAVYCAWAVYVWVQDVGRQCFAGQHPDFQQAVAQEVGRIDRFIIANSSAPVTQTQLDAWKVRDRGAPEQLCSSDGLHIYRSMQEAGIEQLRAGVDELLSIPREPLTSPCF